MPGIRPRLKHASGRTREIIKKIRSRSSTQTVVDIVSQEARHQGFIVLPSTKNTLTHWVTRGYAAGTIQNTEEATTSIAAIVAAAAQEAKASGTIVVRSMHLTSGWTDRLGPTGGNCPPYKCMKRTILARVDPLRIELTGFGELLDSTLEKLDL